MLGGRSTPWLVANETPAVRIDFRGYSGLAYTKKPLLMRCIMEGIVIISGETSTEVSRLKTPLKATATLPVIIL